MQHSVSFICAKFGIPNLSQSVDIGQNPYGGISDLRISGQSFINKNCHDSRTSHGIDMKLWPVTKFEKRNMATLEKFGYDVIMENCDVIVFCDLWPTCSHLEAGFRTHDLQT